jgi:hypothetical protein
MANTAQIESRIALAAEMVKKLDDTVQFTPANRGAALVTDTLGITDHASSVQRVYTAWPTTHYGQNDPTAVVLGHTVSEAHGNCDMKAEVAYSMIFNQGRSPGAANTKVLICQIPGHTFCLLCSSGIVTTPGQSYGIAHYGEEAVVCDGWQSDYYAPNVWWPYGRIPGVEAFVWRKKVASNQLLVVKEHSFYLA